MAEGPVDAKAPRGAVLQLDVQVRGRNAAAPFALDVLVDERVDTLRQRQDVRAMDRRFREVAKLDAAIALANANTFTTPAGWTNGRSYSNTQIARIANTIAAMTLAYYPRDAAENATEVDWAKVAGYASKGMSTGTPFDFVFVAM